jgi:hypothetical protein
MNRYLYVGCSTLLIILFMGCTTVNIESNKELGYNKEIEKVAIIIDSGGFILYTGDEAIFGKGRGTPRQIEMQLGQFLSNNLSKAFTSRGIDNRAFFESKLALSTDSINNSIADYEPEYLMTIDLVDGTTKDNKILMSGNFDTKLYYIHEDKTIWRARLSVQGLDTTGIQTDSAMELIYVLLKALQKDGLISD